MAQFEMADVVKSLPINYFSEIDDRINAKIKVGDDVIDLASGSPDLATDPAIQAAMQAAIIDPSNHSYPPFMGKDNVKDAVAQFYKRVYDVEIDPATEVMIVSSSGVSVVAVPQTLLNPGDTILLTNPAYPPYFAAAKLAQATIYEMPVTAETDFLPDFDAIPEEVAVAAKVMMLNYPNNPTGAVATPVFFEKAIRFAAKYQIAIVHDFAYAAIGYNGVTPLSLMQMKDGKAQGVELYTASKTFSMADYRFGFVVGNASIIAALKNYHSNAYTMVPGFIQDGMTQALTGSLEQVEANRLVYETRLNTLVKGLQAIGWSVEASKGSLFAWFKVPDGFTGASFANYLLDEAQIAVAPGEGFGSMGANYVRVSVLQPTERLVEAVARIAALGLFGEAR
ncbi:aminotransferase class I/II-fold pyridoxal phosphate-dependent enzyme [Brochothrix campestris]|uniref:Transaminase n=1 Tax=Brochothrix campestris FSL F6-1037 TaxID=1265861 RepID=W7CWI6_9LIST|nr:aminotransferase class I/II-fold pyridoxal phosphate-dependent enzyme [Brochothrix campestris]EUJ41327.1 transaminase [Brochothrix campestris FSL F6-1037]